MTVTSTVRVLAIVAMFLVLATSRSLYAVQAPPVRLNPEWSAVLLEEQARAFWKPRLCNRPTPSPIESIWIPDAETIRRLDLALGPALQQAIDLSTMSQSKPRAEEFYRQYAGFVVVGSRIVYINGFHANTVDRVAGRPTQWKTQAQLGCDGGMFFFGAEFHVETGVVDKIIFNGR